MLLIDQYTLSKSPFRISGSDTASSPNVGMQESMTGPESVEGTNLHLYRGSTTGFVEDVRENTIAGKLQDGFREHFGYSPPDGEVRSWQNSLRAMAMTIDGADLHDNGITIEYRLPLTSKRLDCMITGEAHDGQAAAVIVELKQWEFVEASPIDNCVTTILAKGLRDVLHPSAQVGGYTRYLLDAHSAFTESEIDLRGCSYLHNLRRDDADALFDVRFEPLIGRYPAFVAGDGGDLQEHLVTSVGGGRGGPILERILEGRYRPAKQLLRETARVIRGEPAFVLLDEQQVVMSEVLTKIRVRHMGDKRSVIIVRGGPGTGKSAIAVNLLAELSAQGFIAQHATGSKAFTENLRKTVGPRASAQFSYFNNFGKIDEQSIDVLICDEAHRIRENSGTRFTPKSERSERLQIHELIAAAKISVFFIDDRQVVRPGEIGSTALIRSVAAMMGAHIVERELEAQFRCGGSDAYLRWVNNTLDLERGEPALWEGADGFQLEIVDDIHDLDASVRTEIATGHTARLVAGYCWRWSDPTDDGTLVNDVIVGDWSRPWNARPDKKRLAPGIPKSNFWASDPNGVEQVGCIYTAQGFEFDHVGVIWGRDLVYRSRIGWIGQPEHSRDPVVRKGAKADPDQFTKLLKNSYRVLLSRGMNSCSIHIQDDETRNFLLSRIRLVR